MPVLIGALAHPLLRARLAPGGTPVQLAGGVPAWQADWTLALHRFVRILDLAPRLVDGREVLDAGDSLPQPELAAALADWLLLRLADQPPEALRPRLPMILGWIASRLRAGRETPDLPQLGPEGDKRVQMLGWHEAYGDYFSVEAHVLKQRRHRGDWSPDLRRAVFVSGDATVVLPWDPLRDRVMLIDQFRAGPAARGDAQPWLYETIAGRVDAGETPEQAARREGLEEAGLTITRLFAAPHNYPSPGALAEYLYLYVGIADLPDAAAGFGGLDAEDEDIRSYLMPRVELTRMALEGELRNGPLLTLALWLELSAPRLCAELGRAMTA